MKTYTFEPDIYELGRLDKDYRDQIKTEPSLYSCSIPWVLKNAGPITKEITEFIMDRSSFFGHREGEHLKLGYKPVIDTRVTMLMNSNFSPVDLTGEDLEMYQAIPGWHCDGVLRGENGQPDLRSLEENIQHFIVSFSSCEGEIAPTEFVTDSITMQIDEDKPIWRQVNKFVEEESEFIAIKQTEENMVYRFNRGALHRSTPARGKGFRYFYRMSFYHNPPQNEVRVNNNVYLTKAGGGW